MGYDIEQVNKYIENLKKMAEEHGLTFEEMCIVVRHFQTGELEEILHQTNEILRSISKHLRHMDTVI